MSGVTIALAVLSSLALIWSVIQTWSWFRRSDKHAFDLVSLGKFIIFMSGNLATVFFIVMFCVSLKWFLFFKRQSVLHTLLPSVEQEKFLGIYLGIALAMKAIQLIHLLAVQCSINIFFIDWERPRVRASTTSTRNVTSSKNVAETSAGSDTKKSNSSALKGTPDKINAEMAGVSIWRTYFVANEWAEIQSQRKINLSIQLFGVLFFLKVLEFENYALAGQSFSEPSSDLTKYVPYSTCCRFALGATVYLSFAILQMIVRKIIYERFVEDKLQQYVDLCSVSNVSVFILVTKRFGYYIHGRSTHGKADVNMKEMHEFLRKEEEDLCGHRGLLPDTEQQTFQILLPSGVHDQFLRLLVPLTSYSQAADRMQGVGG
ncbi:Meckelin, partial [Stegodyphus mimosarum]